MGHSRADKAQTHQRLVDAAATRFREKGLDGISLADLMKELGLTHGGFYKHFASRDALVDEAVEAAFEQGRAKVQALTDADGRLNVADYVTFYLSKEHRDDPGGGCAICALSSDIARRGESGQASYRKRLDSLISHVANGLSGGDAEARRSQAVMLVTQLYGALLVARGAGDCALSDEILATVSEHVLAGLKSAS